MSVFVFVVKEAFDLPCLPQDYKDEIEISEVFEFFNKCLTEFSFLPQKGSSFPLSRDFRFPMCWQFPRFLEDPAIELVGITEGSMEEVVEENLDSENNVGVVAI